MGGEHPSSAFLSLTGARSRISTLMAIAELMRVAMAFPSLKGRMVAKASLLSLHVCCWGTVGARATFVGLCTPSRQLLTSSGTRGAERSQSSRSGSGFQFAAASSSAPSLSQAVVEACGTLHAKLAEKTPTLIQLLVSVEPYRDSISFAPKFVMECMTGSRSRYQPVLLGGGVQGIIGADGRQGPGVSIMAAVLPGVEATPFHVAGDVVPELPHHAWKRLIVPGAEERTAALILSEPHFVNVDKFISRLQNVVPRTQVIGGVVEPGVAWEGTAMPMSTAIGRTADRTTRQPHIGHGALFLGQETMHEGAVGCFLQGAFDLDVYSLPGCRPLGFRATVTEANGSAIVELDGEPALNVMVRMLEAIQKDEPSGLDLFMGVQEPYSTPGNFVIRHFKLDSPQGILLSALEVPEGSIIQLHARDADWAREKLMETAEVTDSVAGAFVYSCVAAQHFDGELLTSRLGPKVEISGGLCQGEFVKAGHDQTVLSSYCTNVAVLHPIC